MTRESYLADVRKNLPLSLLTGAGCGFTFFFFGPFDIYAGNKEEFRFIFADFGGWLLLCAVAVGLLVSALLLFSPRPVFRVLFPLFFWLTVTGYIQGTFLNVGLNFLRGDAGSGGPTAWLIFFDVLFWILCAVLCVLGTLAMEKMGSIRTLLTVLLIMVLGMQVAGCLSQVGRVLGEDKTHTSDEARETYLSTDGINRVADGQNILVFIVDRFDISYYDEIVAHDPGFFADAEALRGFTLYPDNVTLYTRTYPAACSIITGVEQVTPEGQEFGWTAEEYFDYAYTHSPFLSDLKANDYHVRLYVDPYYAYRHADPLVGIADNISTADGYVISDLRKLVGNMLALSAYRYLPIPCKSVITVTTASFNCTVQYTGDHPAYNTYDPDVFRLVKEEGVSFDGNERSFIYLHLAGCHTPCRMDEYGNEKKNATVEETTRGCFRLISMYIDELKRLGVFDTTTILITGDHPWDRDDTRLITEPRLSPVLFKPAYAEDAPLRVSSAQVSQDNLLASLVSSAGLTTTHTYGVSYGEVPEGVDIPRRHKYEAYLKGRYYVAEYTVTGAGRDLSHWEGPKTTPIGYLYK